MHALSALGRVPGVSVTLPLLAGMALATAGADPGRLGPFAAGLGGDAVGFVAILLVCVGAQLTPRSIRPVAGRVAVVLAGATVVPALAVLAYGFVFGRGGLGGVSVVAVAVAAVTTSNALWLALSRRYGNAQDAWGGSVAAILCSAPAVPIAVLMVLHRSGGAVAWRGLLDAVLPLAVGATAGMIVPACRAMLAHAIPVLLVMVSFALGLQLDLHPAVRELPGGLVLGVATALVSGGLVAAGWRWVLRRPDTVGWAAAGSAVTVPLMPAIAATTDPVWAPYAATATAQLGVALIVSTLAAPLLTAASARWRRTHTTPATDDEPGRARGEVRMRGVPATRGVGAHR